MQIPASPYARYLPPVERPAPSPPSGIASPQSSTLRDVLTPEEQQFFADAEALGPLWYGHAGVKDSAPAPPLGQRLDVRG
ncbi:MAG: hypothetical protein HOP28_06740 [Gemmatimonadales bacterium]|nr:hypothetical protein [Gemmatimonadales bacterium]